MNRPRGDKKRFTELEVRMPGRDEHVYAILHHARGQDLSEGPEVGVEISEHGVAPPPSCQADGVCVDPRKKDHH